jgi:uncharacterized protein (TIGR03118 family)
MTNNTIYLADFANQRIDVYDFGWANLRNLTDAFIDPDLPTGYSPFNIFAGNNVLYVMYAKIDLTTGPPYNKILTGEGLGIINVFTLDGILVKRAVTGGRLNAPWGITLSKHHFAGSEGKYLIGNHGDGLILVYDSNWACLGRLHYTKYDKHIIGLYGLCSVHDSVYFTAAPNGLVSGIVGKIDKKSHDRCEKSYEKCETASIVSCTSRNKWY